MPPGRRVGAAAVALLAAAAMLAALVGVWRSTPAAAPAGGASAPPPDQGTAHVALLGAVGFSVDVTAVQREAQPPGAPDPGAGLHYVAVRLRFRNTSSAQQRADPRDFRLLDAAGKTREPTFLPAPTGCARWPRTDLNPSGPRSAPPRDPEAEQAGPAFGPVDLCFAAGGDPNGPLALLWDPDVSFPLLGSPTRIALR